MPRLYAVAQKFQVGGWDGDFIKNNFPVRCFYSLNIYYSEWWLGRRYFQKASISMLSHCPNCPFIEDADNIIIVIILKHEKKLKVWEPGKLENCFLIIYDLCEREFATMF